jgi:hypothetical protein
VLLSLALALAPIAVQADDARVLMPFYRDDLAVTVPCAVGSACRIKFAPGEIMGDAVNAHPEWYRTVTAYGNAENKRSATARLIVQAVSAHPKRTTIIVLARNTSREYDLSIVPTNDGGPTLVSYRYDTPTPAPSSAPKPQPSPKTLTQEDRAVAAYAAACAQNNRWDAKPDADRRGHVDDSLRAVQPARVCSDRTAVYVEEPDTRGLAVHTLPVVYEAAPGSDIAKSNARYFEGHRLFVVPTTSNLVLRVTVGRDFHDVHVTRGGAK